MSAARRCAKVGRSQVAGSLQRISYSIELRRLAEIVNSQEQIALIEDQGGSHFVGADEERGRLAAAGGLHLDKDGIAFRREACDVVAQAVALLLGDPPDLTCQLVLTGRTRRSYLPTKRLKLRIYARLPTLTAMIVSCSASQPITADEWRRPRPWCAWRRTKGSKNPAPADASTMNGH